MTQAIAKMEGISISTKDAIEISNAIRNKTTIAAKALLERAINYEVPIAYRRFTNGIGHKSGSFANARFPITAAKAMHKLVRSAEANAGVKGLDVNHLIISAIVPNRGSRSPHHGRKRGIQTKSTHVTITVEEKKND